MVAEYQEAEVEFLTGTTPNGRLPTTQGDSRGAVHLPTAVSTPKKLEAPLDISVSWAGQLQAEHQEKAAAVDGRVCLG